MFNDCESFASEVAVNDLWKYVDSEVKKLSAVAEKTAPVKKHGEAPAGSVSPCDQQAGEKPLPGTMWRQKQPLRFP